MADAPEAHGELIAGGLFNLSESLQKERAGDVGSIPGSTQPPDGAAAISKGDYSVSPKSRQAIRLNMEPIMANFIVTYDLNGPLPTHQQMDVFLSKLVAKRGRILETVWWVDYPGSVLDLRNQVQTILGREDLLLVIEAKTAAWTKLLVDDNAFKQSFDKAA